MYRQTLLLPLVLLFVASTTAEAQKPRQRNRNVGILVLVAHPKVHQELKLNDEQKSALKKAVAEARQQTKEYRKLEAEARRTKSRQTTQALRKTVAETLNADQADRLSQIELQYSTGAWIVIRKDVARKLNLTREQRREIRDLGKTSGELVRKLRAASNDDNRKANQQKITAALAKARKDALALLTAEQKEKWNKAKGEPFELPRRKRNRKKKKKKQD